MDAARHLSRNSSSTPAIFARFGAQCEGVFFKWIGCDCGFSDSAIYFPMTMIDGRGVKLSVIGSAGSLPHSLNLSNGHT